MLKSTGERRQPCLTPTVVLKEFPMVLFRNTAEFEFMYRDSMVLTSICCWYQKNQLQNRDTPGHVQVFFVVLRQKKKRTTEGDLKDDGGEGPKRRYGL
ncbi:hypothetical protein ElyMa_001597000 [Elysia marginata]|uniref:Uncharacterized protein n=1 Tax=Elysia marginata TaxID=1093978 RepID=A0AAV4JFH2_9GAST|nr:hypothetical protein ElyMa_001597000 [Elysia marginata]